MTDQNVDGLRRFVAARRGHVDATEHERFRLLTGFNDVFVAVCCIMILAAAAYLGSRVHEALAGAAMAVVSWGLAEYFTRRLRLSLSSIVLLIGFAGGTLAAGLMGMVDLLDLKNVRDPADAAGAVAAATLLAGAGSYAHWRRFMVPITVAAGSAIGLSALFALLLLAVPSLRDSITVMVLVGGLAMFAIAMRWDSQDRERNTRRSDVAFWLHLAASPMIIHPVFSWVGVNGAVQVVSPGLALAACIGTYLAIALVSLAIDRRAMLISALVYVLYAMGQLFSMAGTAREMNMALAALVIGSGLLLLSARWEAARRLLVPRLPGQVREALPLAR
ncbi:hypothetical protein [Niveispirillum sp. KHB5.9]|uniref:hypothetical protein n=1 Tax=Niveispirillum sp. KHB5.9 TaxID=3400269 RepID=UPI003A89E9D6